MDATPAPPVRRPRGSTVVKASPLRAIGPARQRPAKAAQTGRKGWIQTIEDVWLRVESAIKNRRHHFHRELAGARSSTAGHEIQRAIRTDGLTNLHSVVCVLVSHAEVGQWLIADRRKNHQRPSVEKLDERAFGPLVEKERSPKRTWRALRLLRAAGYLRVDRLVQEGQDGQLREQIAVRHLTRKFFDFLGLGHLVSAAARDADREPGRRRETLLSPLRETRSPTNAIAFVSKQLVANVEALATTDPPPRPPPAKPISEAAAAAIAQINSELGTAP